MKALILAAGLGTRLRPYTDKIPKCLFPIAGRPNLDISISKLIAAGCSEVIINTHHLHDKITDFLSSKNYPIPVHIRHEPQLLGTGGSIKNLSGFWDGTPFFVINSDVVCDADLSEMYAFHQNHDHPVTLCMVDDPEFNIVGIDPEGFILRFTRSESAAVSNNIIYKTLSGIHVLDPLVLDFIPENQFSSSIEAYQKMIAQGFCIKAYQPDPVYWQDIGSPERYQQAVYDEMAPDAFKTAFPENPPKVIEKNRIKGDGSDRSWFRLNNAGQTLILAKHEIAPVDGLRCEAEAFVFIGNHLYAKHLPVPKIHLSDTFSGLVFLEDLGNEDLETVVTRIQHPETLKQIYHAVIENIVELSVRGKKDFDLSWTYQTPYYDVPMILEKECRYFVDAFLNGYLNMGVEFHSLENEFTALAQKATQTETFGFMHRDCQHRNIMVKEKKYYFIDFQGGRIGPLTYDLAALMIDPYVHIPEKLVPELVTHCYNSFSKNIPLGKDMFLSSYYACSLTRNLQILGAFSFLSQQKNKPEFEKYIVPALKSLQKSLSEYKELNLSGLRSIVNGIKL